MLEAAPSVLSTSIDRLSNPQGLRTLGRMDIQAVIFELDGVLVVTDRYELRAWHAFCRERSWSFPGRLGSDEDTLEAILLENGVSPATVALEDLHEEKQRRYLAALETMESEDFYPGAVGFVIELRAFEIPTAIATADLGADRIISVMDVGELFDTIVLQEIKGRSASTRLKEAAENLGVEPRSTAVFADDNETLSVARALGMRAIGVGPVDRVEEADRAIQNFTDIDFADFLAQGRPERILDEHRNRTAPSSSR